MRPGYDFLQDAFDHNDDAGFQCIQGELVRHKEELRSVIGKVKKNNNIIEHVLQSRGRVSRNWIVIIFIVR